MENLTLAQLKDFAVVALALLAFVVLLGNAVKAMKDWKKPRDDLLSWRRGVDDTLSSDSSRLRALEDGNRVICRGILALLSHEINGNSVDKLRASQQELTNYLIEK